MFVITADQIDSRHDRDRAGDMMAALGARYGDEFALPPDQTSGDEIQMLITDPEIALNVILILHRSGYWSVGLGIGQVRMPLPASTRQASGEAFIAARNAVTRAKKADAHVAIEMPTAPQPVLTANQVEALLAMLLLLRQRRSEEGWEAVDLLEKGLSQVDIAAMLGISTAAVSQRVKATQFRVEQTARPAIVRLLENLDRSSSDKDTRA
ncbi:hypothetical protein GY21_06275 [Cryobacterium roopkundense]|uniref:DNA-binding protein n=1 Tax=Cryobacterium roopkundense TaxID=1001240 RepID=A0A099JND7_9MICO|nr:hypothetical protein [Cryobacterium roopkundense]KGJ78993.1 hypothetical protein GY21_06275 [Cryobacterium roopkundense]MBB5640400.1 hypothetical protein [Cryobacterium roopkundense]